MLLNKKWFATKPIFGDNTGNVFYLSMLWTWFWISSKNLYIAPDFMGYFYDELIERIWEWCRALRNKLTK